MKIEIQRNESSQPLVYEGVINAYTKGPMYCVMFEKEGQRVTHKFPLCSLFRIIEDYLPSKK
ncbi:hypothetical protein [Sinorhizobium meliloti]|uniref:hypothetical protein n=1 Tax=Rhizobium meliloti TaxID=382 RepID=UPI000FDC7EE3|nr:hypothetical protein [Sinorhizobium meliloti]RVN04628.1 hypothetical protein CN112_24880 [Sinorhizobium meliloti]